MPLAPCTHCGTPTPAAPNHAETFCCSGCASAYSLIHACGLEDYYRFAEPKTDGPLDAVAVDYADFDRREFLEAHATLDAGERRATLALEGMHCAACVWLLERLPTLHPGVLQARVDWRRATIEVRWDAAQTGLGAIATALANLGYRPTPLRLDDPAGSGRTRPHAQRRLIHLALAFAAAGNNMLIAVGLYLGEASGITGDMASLLRWASCAVGAFSLAVPGRTFFTGAWAAIRARVPHMDLPVALGLSIGGIAGLVNTIRGTGEIYFDTLSALVFLLLLGRWLQVRQQDQAASSIELLYRITPTVAHRVDDEGIRIVPADVLRCGDVVEVRAGDVIPADGVVLDGASAVDHAVLTGEARPVTVEVGNAAVAGATNLTAPLRVRIDAVGTDTRIGSVVDQVTRASTTRPPIVRFADRIAGWFVTTVVLLAALTFVAWTWLDPSVAVDHTVALLIVACPCALGLATPLALNVALGRAAKRRILVKGGSALQRLSKPGHIWFDKTGTITQGRMRVVHWHGSEEDLARLAALEAHVVHPIAAAVLDHAPERPRSAAAENVTVVDGGVTGLVDGVSFGAGHAGFATAHMGAPLERGPFQRAAAWVEAGLSPLFVVRDGVIVGMAALGDPLRDDARAVIDALRARGWTVAILSGDHADVVERVGAQLGLRAEDCRGGLSPAEKAALVSAEAGRTTVMVGDGVNDSGALMAATVGIAVHGGAEASLRAAPVYLGRPDLGALVELVDDSTAAVGTIRRTLSVSLLYNAVAVGLAATGVMSPLVAALLMPLSSVSVIAAALAPTRRP